MTTYTLTNGTDVVRDSDGARIHADPTLFDWQAYQAWLADGNTPNPYVAPTPPALVSRVVSVGFVRFTVVAGLVTTTADTVGVGAITRISAGRYRVAYLAPDPTQTLVAQPDFLDTVPRIIRVQSPRNPSYTEIRVTDLTGAAVDPPEVTVLINKVVSS